jgi:hypothetical protein
LKANGEEETRLPCPGTSTPFTRTAAAAVTNEHKLGDLTQQKCILLQFWKTDNCVCRPHALWRLN